MLRFGPLIVVALAAALRLYGINWDNGHLFHPDERAILFHVNDMAWPRFSDLTVLFDPENSPMNPQWFPYGSLPLYLVKAIQLIGSPFTHMDFHDLRIVGRGLSALSDLGTVVMVFLLGAKLYGRNVGLLASLLCAVSVLHIQLSHFYTVDTYLAFFLISSMYFMACVMERGKLKDSILAGSFIGLALACKISIAPIFVVFVACHSMYWFRPSQTTQATSKLIIRNFTLGIVASALVFFITTPYGILDWTRPDPCEIPFYFLKFLENNYFACDVGAQINMARGTSGLPFTQQYIDTIAYLYQIRQLALFGLGLPLGVLVWISVLFTIASAVYRRNKADLLLLAWIIPYFVLTGYLQVKFLRYMLPLTPFLIILAARMLFWIKDKSSHHLPRYINIVKSLMVLLVLSTIFYGFSYMNVYMEPHTAARASEWINEHVENQSIILIEHWEEQVPLLSQYKIGCGNIWDSQSCMTMYEPDDKKYPSGIDKMTKIAQQLSGADYLVFFSNRLYGTIPRLPERYPDSRQYYVKLFGEELGFQLEHWETTYPTLMGLALIDDTFKRPELPIPEALGLKPAPLSINLGYADESFSVYDHPKVLIFKNIERLSWQDIHRELVTENAITSKSNQLLLTQSTLASQQGGGTWTTIFDSHSLANRFPTVIWFVWIQILAILALPISAMLFKPLPDKGYILAKPLGVLLVAYVTWLLASLEWMPFSRNSILFSALLMSSVSLLLIYTKRVVLFSLFRENLRTIAIGETIFLASFMVFLAIRAANPDLWHPFNGGEKPMEMAYLNAVIRSTYMPPYDPWFSGGYINYYYFGQFIVASIVKVTGILPETAFNLAVPLFFSLSAIGVYSLVFNLAEGTRKIAPVLINRAPPALAAMIAVFFVLIIGNIDGLIQLIEGLINLFKNNQPFGQFDFWRSSRMIPPGNPRGFEITEFPFFTFLFADLHAHMMAIPFALLSLSISLSLAVKISNGSNLLERTLHLMALGLTIGSLRAINTWDFPTYLIISASILLIAEYAKSNRVSFPMIARTCGQILFLFWMTTLLFSPFIENYQSFNDGIIRSKWQTPLISYLAIHSLFVFIIVTFFAKTCFKRRIASHPAPITSSSASNSGKEISLNPRNKYLPDEVSIKLIILISVVIASLIAIIIIGYTTLAFILTLLMALALSVHKQQSYRITNWEYETFAPLLIVIALAIGAGVELITIQGDIARMNTVFKFYFQAWILFGIASAYLLWYMGVRLNISKNNFIINGPNRIILITISLAASWIAVIVWLPVIIWLFYGLICGLAAWIYAPARGYTNELIASSRGFWLIALAILLTGSSIYTVAGTRDRLRDRFEVLPLSLNGLAYMDNAIYYFDGGNGTNELKWDYQAIQYLRSTKIQGSPVILEGQGELYRTLHSRASIYTGLPTVLGWDNHQGQQRGYGMKISQRKNDIRYIYSTTDTELALNLLDKYKVKYIYVGDIERHYYPEEGIAKFSEMLGSSLSMAYKNERVTIYEIIPDNARIEQPERL